MKCVFVMSLVQATCNLQQMCRSHTSWGCCKRRLGSSCCLKRTSMFQTLQVPSWEATAARVLSGENATHITCRLCPYRTHHHHIPLKLPYGHGHRDATYAPVGQTWRQACTGTLDPVIPIGCSYFRAHENQLDMNLTSHTAHDI